MPIPFAINGLGRVGRALLRCARSLPQLELVAVNDRAPAAALARLVARDSIYGSYAGEVAADGDFLLLDGRRIPVHGHPDPRAVPWSESGARIVVEASGAGRTGDFARGHLSGGVERVVAAWNPRDPREVDVTLCAGINQEVYDPRRHRLISNASCTTHCIAPIVRVLHRGWGLRRGMVNSVHAVTNNQSLLDAPHTEARRARSGMLNIVPTASHAAAAVGVVLPELAGRLEGFVVRVPAPQGALLDLVVELERPAAVAEVAEAFREAAAGPLAPLLAVTSDDFVSSDVLGDPRSAVVDLPLLQAVGGGLLRVVAWYDNEWAYAHRLAELLLLLGGAAPPAAGTEGIP